MGRPPATRSPKDLLIPHFVAQSQAFSRFCRHVPGLFGALLLLLWQLPAAAEPVEIEADTELATAGYYQLSWDTGATAIVLQEASTPDFASPRVVYRGADNARVMSGKPNGDWYYRARTAGSDGEFGNVVKVTVRHHSLARALSFFALGALVFLVTLAVIIKGAQST